MKIPEIRPISDLARDAKKLVELARAKQEPIVITQRGRDAAVLLPIELYRKLQAGRTYKVPSVRLANPADAEFFKMKMEVIEPKDDADLTG
jgi:prevent-host-death family protein